MAPPGDAPQPEDEPKARHVSRKLFKRRPKDPATSSVEMPERLKYADDTCDEVISATSDGPTMYMDMNQSIFGLIAAAGSRLDPTDRFHPPESSDEEDDADESSAADADSEQHVARTTILARQAKSPKSTGDKPKHKHRSRLSEHKLLRSLPALPRLAKSRLSRHQTKSSAKSSSTPSDARSDADESAAQSTDTADDTRLAPVMSRMLEARAEMAARPSFDLERLSGEAVPDSDAEGGVSPLARKLKEIFEFAEPEEVIEEYPCWLLQSVLLQGFMYVTTNHICFYAYLPKKGDDVAKSGYLSKSGRRNPKYNRYWFRLKGDVLSYYPDTTNVYFPNGQIDLRYAISVNISDKDKEGLHFTVSTNHRTYHLRADSAPSAKEWVKAIQRVIFRSHNDGDSVKISLPIENIIDIEDIQMLEFADTCKIRVLDNDETFVLDEYYFSFFNNGKDAINILKILAEDSAARHQGVPTIPVLAHRHDSPKDKPEILEAHKPREAVRATLFPQRPSRTASPRGSADVSRASFDAFKQFSGRKSLDVASNIQETPPRRSFSGARRSHDQVRQSIDQPRSLSQSRHTDAKNTPGRQTSSESFVQSIDDPSISALVMSASDDPSASQILQGSEVFQSPTIRRSGSPSAVKGEDPSTKSVQAPLPSSTTAVPYHSIHHAATTGSLPNRGDQELGDEDAPGTPSLQNIAKMSAYPLQRAGAFALYLNSTSRKMSSLLASESMGYVEKVSGMWKGGRKHYEKPHALRTGDDDDEDDSDGAKHASANERFRAHFALPETEKLQAAYFGHLFRVLPLYGKIYISDHYLCFRSLLIGTRTKLILPLKDIENVNKEKGFTFGYSGLVMVIRGHEELFFEFSKSDIRDDCTVTLLQALEKSRYLKESGVLNSAEQLDADVAKAERDALLNEREGEDDTDCQLEPTQVPPDGPPMLFGDGKTSMLDFKPTTPMKITCLTIGSRGDVQPYIALCKGLIREGHKPRIATHDEFKGWIEGHGIEFAKVEGDPGELMRLCIEHGTFTWSFLREANSAFRGWLDELLVSAWTACQGSDLIIESPSAMAGIHIAEALGVPYFRAFTMPWTRTRAYPHAFIMPETKMGGAYNVTSYVLFDNVFWKATAYQINRWRRNTLKLPNTSLEKLQPNKVPFMYNFSPSVVAPPIDFSDWIRVTGYWFLDEATGWTPPKELSDFIEKAKRDGKKLVYVGFGSIIVKDPAKMTQEVIDAVHAADVRCVLSKGWSDRLTKDGPPAVADEPPMPPEIHVIKSAPHDWLFSHMDAAAHHGGSGTTGASLRAGIPTIIRPFFGDQFFFGSRVEDLGVGIWLRKWGANSFGRALWEATHNERMVVRAKALGQKIRKENGVETAIKCIYRDLEYARSLIKKKPAEGEPHKDDDDDEPGEESWTFVGRDEPDPEMLTRRLSDLYPGLEH